MQVEVGPQETISQPMERRMAYVLSRESVDTSRITGHPKSKNEIPSPRRTASQRARKMK